MSVWQIIGLLHCYRPQIGKVALQGVKPLHRKVDLCPERSFKFTTQKKNINSENKSHGFKWNKKNVSTITQVSANFMSKEKNVRATYQYTIARPVAAKTNPAGIDIPSVVYLGNTVDSSQDVVIFTAKKIRILF